MANTIVDRDGLNRAKTALSTARDALTSENGISTRIFSVTSLLQSSEVWQGQACDVFTTKLNEDAVKLMKLTDILSELVGYCNQVDSDLGAYLNYLRSIVSQL